MNSPPASRTDERFEQGFQLGELRVLPPTGEVIGPGGAEQLDPKVMDVLVLLVQYAGHVVPREDLLARVWKNAIVTDDALSRCIYELRRALSQAGGNPRLKALIETVPKRGYRLRAEVTVPGVRAGDRPGKRPWRLALAAAAGVLLAALLWITVGRQAVESEIQPPLAASNSIAVLPFVDMSAEQSQAYMADGFSEEILNRLAQAGNLLVISRTSSFAFREKPVDMREIATKLGVRHVLEGSVRKSGDSIRITAQLIAAADNSHLWSETFDRKLGDMFAIQDEIAASVATALQVKLAGGKPHGLMPATVEAYDNYLQGQFFYHRRAPGDVERSARYYEAAVAMDPGYARAWAALSGAFALLRRDDPRNARVLLDKQGQAALKAVELDPELAAAHARLANFYYVGNDARAGNHHLERAAALDPDDPLVLGGVASRAIYHGNPEAAIDAWRRSMVQDPLVPTARINLASTLAVAGQPDQALAEYRRVLELSPDIGWEIELDVVRMLILLRRFDEAQRELARISEGRARDYGLAMLYELPARRAEAAAALDRLAATQTEHSRDVVRLADVYSYRGMREQAFAVLQAGKESFASDQNFSAEKAWTFREDLQLSPFLKPLHSDPRWTALLTKPT